MQCAISDLPTPVLLFGDYQWNKRLSGPSDATDKMSFDQRLEAVGGKEFWKDDVFDVPNGVPLYRVKDWSEVVRWVVQAKSEGRM